MWPGGSNLQSPATNAFTAGRGKTGWKNKRHHSLNETWLSNPKNIPAKTMSISYHLNFHSEIETGCPVVIKMCIYIIVFIYVFIYLSKSIDLSIHLLMCICLPWHAGRKWEQAAMRDTESRELALTTRAKPKNSTRWFSRRDPPKQWSFQLQSNQGVPFGFQVYK